MRDAIIHHPQTVTLARTVTLRDAPGHPVRCAWCSKRILDPASVSFDPATLDVLRHHDVVLDDTVYVAQGPDGEREFCLHCAVQSGITRGTTGGQLDDYPPTHPVALLWGRRWALLALFGSLLIVLVVFEIFVVDVGTWEGAAWDRPILQTVHEIDIPAHSPLLRAIAALGGLGVTAPLCALTILVLSLRRRWRNALYVGVVYGGALAANVAVNVTFSTANIWWGAPGPSLGGGYLSPAAMGSLALWSALTVLAWPTRWRWPTLTLAAIVSILVGVVHTAVGGADPSDVLGGWAGSLVWSSGVYLTLIFSHRLDADSAGGQARTSMTAE